MRRIGARDQRLGRGTAGVDAGAAEELAFDDGDLPACATSRRAKAGPACPVPMMIASIVRHDWPPILTLPMPRTTG